jgi:hypothetical protein
MTTGRTSTPRPNMVKYVEPKPLSDPATAARKLIEIASGVEAVQDGRIHIEKVNGPFLFEIKGTPAQYKAGLTYAIERGWIEMHRSGTFIRFTQSGADLFA